MDEAVLRGIVDGHQPEFALLITSQDYAQPALERTGKYFRQVSSPKFHVASHDVDTRWFTDDPQVTTWFKNKFVWRVTSRTNFSRLCWIKLRVCSRRFRIDSLRSAPYQHFSSPPPLMTIKDDESID